VPTQDYEAAGKAGGRKQQRRPAEPPSTGRGSDIRTGEKNKEKERGPNWKRSSDNVLKKTHQGGGENLKQGTKHKRASTIVGCPLRTGEKTMGGKRVLSMLTYTLLRRGEEKKTKETRGGKKRLARLQRMWGVASSQRPKTHPPYLPWDIPSRRRAEDGEEKRG